MMGNLDVAIDEFGSALRYSKQTPRPYYPDANLRRGIIYFRQEKYDLAIEDFQEAAVNPGSPLQEDPRATFWLGLAFARKANYPDAARAYTRAINSYPEYTAAFVNRGLAYLKSGRYERAFSDFNIAVRLDSTNETARKYREIARSYLN